MTALERPGATEGAVFWSADGNSLEYILSVRGVGNIWRQSIHGGAPLPVTRFRAGELFFFNLSADRKTLVMARGKEINGLVRIRGIRSRR